MKILQSTGLRTSPCVIYMYLDSDMLPTEYSFSARCACTWDCPVGFLTTSEVKVNDTYYHSHITKVCYPVTEGY